MKTAIYFMKLFGAGAIALGGFVMFISGFSAGVASAFWGLAVTGFGSFLLAHVLETCECPVTISAKKEEGAAKEEAAPAEEIKETVE